MRAIRLVRVVWDAKDLPTGVLPEGARRMVRSDLLFASGNSTTSGEQGNRFFLTLISCLPLFVVSTAVFIGIVRHYFAAGFLVVDGLFSLSCACVALFIGGYPFLLGSVYRFCFRKKSTGSVCPYAGVPFFHCSIQISRRQRIALLMFPGVVLGFMPLCFLWVFRDVWIPFLSIFLLGSSFAMTFPALVCCYEARDVFYQVPRNAYIFDSGLDTYWCARSGALANSAKLGHQSARGVEVCLVLITLAGFVLGVMSSPFCVPVLYFALVCTIVRAEKFCLLLAWALCLGVLLFVFLSLL